MNLSRRFCQTSPSICLALLMLIGMCQSPCIAHAQTEKDHVVPLEIIISDLPANEASSAVRGGVTVPSKTSKANQQPYPIATPTPTSDLQRKAVVLPNRWEPANPKQAQTVMAICPPDLMPALSTWIEYRQQQGYRIVHVDGRLSSMEILTAIRKYAAQQRVDYVVIVGDADLQMNLDPAIRQRSVPTFVVSSEINTELGVETHIATDNPYGDLNGDFIPDVAVGRISVDTPEQLRLIVRKVIDYERIPRRGEWRRTIQLAAGVGDFGILADTIIEKAAKKLITDGIPAAYRTGFTYGNWRSPFCPDPRLFREHMLLQVEQGCLFWVYMGHGRAHRLDRFTVGNLLIPVLESRDARRFQSHAGMPIAVLLACYTGAFEQPRDCLAERLLRVPNGPIAVLASSRVAMPYSMAVLGTSLMEATFGQDGSRSNSIHSDSRQSDRPFRVLGDVVLQGKRVLASTAANGKNRKLMDSLAKALSPTKEKLPVERREHTLMFNLLGDPLLRIELPRTLRVTTESHVNAGETLIVRGTSPIGGRCQVELVCRRDRMTFDFSRRLNLEGGNQTLVNMNQTYAQANNQVWQRRQVELRPGDFAIELTVPAAAKGYAHTRLMIEGDDDIALGAADVYIRMAGGKDDLRKSNAVR